MPARPRQRPPPAPPAPPSSSESDSDSIDALREAHPDFLAWAENATRDEFFALLVRVGIYTRRGRLTKEWWPEPGEEPVLPFVWPKSGPPGAKRTKRTGPSQRPDRKPRAEAPAPRRKSPRARTSSPARRSRKA